MPSAPSSRIPPWLRTRLPDKPAFHATSRLMDQLGLHTVCRSAKCPNMCECFGKKVATFLIMGNVCTRNCAFCNITPGRPAPLDPEEPARLARASAELGLRHVVITSVTRDDLPDGGAAHFAACIRAVRKELPAATVEVLIPDFQGNEAALNVVLEAKPEVLNHNLETAPALYAAIRPQADYAQSIELLTRAKARGGVLVKSGLMVGLGETDGQVLDVVRDLAGMGCDMVTIGQYMRPSREHPEVARYVRPEFFNEYAAAGRALGIRHMFCAPLVRSSYNAAEFV